MAVSKTRAKLVDVARQLFAKRGVDDTTMNDIAVASKKGRRTLYTYFKSKEDIYMAVVESELEMLSDAMEQVAKKDITPDEKILKLIETHLDSINRLCIETEHCGPASSVIYGVWKLCVKTLIQKKLNFSNKYWRKEKTRVFLILIM